MSLLAPNTLQTALMNAGANAATSVGQPIKRPRLETGTNLQVESDAQELSKQQVQVLDIDVTSLRYRQGRVYQTSATGSVLNYIYYPEGWHHPSATTITLPVQFTMFDIAGNTTLTPAQATTAINNLSAQGFGLTNLMLPFTYNAPFNPFARFFNTFQTKIGNPGVLVNQYSNDVFPNIQNLTFLQYMTNILDVTYTDKFSHLLKNGRNGNLSTYAGGVVTLNVNAANQFLQQYQFTGTNEKRALAFFVDMYYSIQNGVPMELTLPMKLFCGIFNQPDDLMLPPQLPYSFFMNLNLAPQIFMTFGGLAIQAQIQLNNTNPTAAQNPFFTFLKHDFTAMGTNTLNINLLQNQILTNFFETRVTPISNPLVPANSTNWFTNLTIASTNPIAYILYFTNPNATDGQLFPSYQNFTNSPMPNIYISYVKIEIGGYEQIVYDQINSASNFQFIQNSDQDLMTNFVNKNMENMPEFLNFSSKSQGMGFPLFINIDAKDIISRTSIKAPLGPITSILTIKFGQLTGINTNPLTLGPTQQDLQLNCVEINHYQMVIAPTLETNIINSTAKVTGPEKNAFSQSNQVVPTTANG